METTETEPTMETQQAARELLFTAAHTHTDGMQAFYIWIYLYLYINIYVYIYMHLADTCIQEYASVEEYVYMYICIYSIYTYSGLGPASTDGSSFVERKFHADGMCVC